MAKIRLTKNELKQQKDNLKRFVRYLPTLELKKKQLLMEIRALQHRMDELEADRKRAETELARWVAVFADKADLESLIRVSEVVIDQGNVAGIDIPVFKEIRFEETEPDFLTTPLWVDSAVEVTQTQIKNRVQRELIRRQQEILQEELRTTIQRIKLFEEVKIPEARENIRVIQIFLGDQQTAEVVRGKIAKNKIERKKAEAANP
ncbi:MAG TPA: V-type ATP synthase subunit D [bacterium]|nr:V-type ATP synthase subunit D [bacterium]